MKRVTFGAENDVLSRRLVGLLLTYKKEPGGNCPLYSPIIQRQLRAISIRNIKRFVEFHGETTIIIVVV